MGRMTDISAQWAHETETGWILRFPEPAQRLSMNDRLHYIRRHILNEAWIKAAFWWAKANGLPKHLPACDVRVTFPVTSKRRRDSDNPAPTVKAIVDGLVLAECWPDDTPEWVETRGSRFDPVSRVVVVELIRR